MEWAAVGICLYVNTDKTEYMYFNQRGDISTLKGGPSKLVDKFTYLGSSVLSTKKDINMRLAKVWTAIDRLLVIWKSDLTDKIKHSFFQAVGMSILLYGCTTWTLTNYTRMLQAILNKSWRQYPTKQQLYSHQPPIMKTIQVRWSRYAEHYWRSKDKLISDILLWTPSYGWAKAGQLARTYIQQLCADTGYSLEDQPRVMDDRDGWQERVKEIHSINQIFVYKIRCCIGRNRVKWIRYKF